MNTLLMQEMTKPLHKIYKIARYYTKNATFSAKSTPKYPICGSFCLIEAIQTLVVYPKNTINFSINSKL